ncbi:phytoene desaturase family protein [Oscillatoria laete-virens NRMC-F 0139]|nr:phytoene desaturase family protein [Oscillatoria laete-virens]MDL5054773.1 phytoene desaturase family protein [Oscillatoria laete-virens NRMC-F 0139]
MSRKAKSHQAVVIGAGLGGLAAAIRLQAKGYETHLYEGTDRPGGRAGVYEIEGFRFDAGPTILTAPFLIDELFALGGGKKEDYIETILCDPFYRIIFADGSHIDYRGGPGALAAEIRRLSPDDEKGFARFARFSERVFARGFVDLADHPFLTLWDMLKVAPDMLRLEAWRSVHAKAASCVRDPRLRFLFSFHPLFIGGSPFRTPSLYAMVHHLELKWGVHYCMGGTGQLVAGLVRHFEKLGGKLHLSAPVEQITLDDGRASGLRLKDGRHIPADFVVSNADVATTYGKLLPAGSSKRWSPRKLRRAEYSMGLFIIYFGLNRKYDALEQHTIILSKRYRELIDDIFERKILPEDFSLYLFNPSKVDPSVAPPGCSACYVLSPVPNLQAHIDWDKIQESYADKILAALESHCPDLRKHIVCKKIITPVDFAGRFGAWDGNAFSLAPTLMQSAWFRPHNRSEDIPGLHIVGAGTHPGAGVPGVLCSAKIMDHLMASPPPPEKSDF